MPAVKAANPRDVFAAEDWRAITRLSRWRGIWLVLHGWMVVALAAFGGAAAWDYHWLAGLLATPVVLAILGGRQLGLSILMHDGAHGLLHPNRKTNNWLGQWPTGAATGSDLFAYRTYHLTHHKYTQQPEDPDLSLSAPFPTSRDSLRRKFIRDLTGQTFYKQRRAQFAGALRGASPTAHTVGRFLALQAILLTISLLVWGWTPFLLWLAALATSFQLFLRIRNIAEHACTPTGSGDPFTHARTTYAGLIARATVAPYWVNYHSEHHLFMGVPCYNLAATHRLLGSGGYHPKMTLSPHYRDVLAQAVN
ncbi:fatty acid desaturase family protein [Sphingorhabdus sp. EL138]|jgi:fatty acid desaturase|uniref:fatty acid desaturase family protein n=1 Tax=Sphingorhabdus sp. EL138 TaxID=2073156 RepID=UPI0025F62B4B|nr:fatty acid desaturase family protein [Sphingorhabdus sp. EL138]